MNSRSRKILPAALQTPVLDDIVLNEFSSNYLNSECAALSPVPPYFPDSNEVFTQIMEQKSGPIFVDKKTTSDESRDTTNWLPPNNNKSIISSSVSDDFNTPSCSRIIPNETNFSISNINSELEEALEVGIEALRLPRKTNIRELKKKNSKE